MYFRSWDELEKEAPFCDGKWDKDKLQEYLIQSCNEDFAERIDLYFVGFRNDGNLADLLFEFLLNEDYNGSDCQIGAVIYIRQLDRAVLKERKALVLKAQQNEVLWRRPFQTDEYLDWMAGEGDIQPPCPPLEKAKNFLKKQ